MKSQDRSLKEISLQFIMKTVSVHILTYNSANFISACLDAVQQQTYPINQIIVVDNCSRDDTRDILSRYNEQITTIFNQTNTGFAGGHNHAMRLSKSDYCLVLNPDVILHPDYVRCLMEFAEGTEEPHLLGSLTGKLVRTSNQGIADSCGIHINRARRAFDIGSGREADRWSSAEEVFGVSGAAALYNMDMVRDLTYNGQFFDEDFFAYKEDVDVSWRAQLFGWKSFFVPDARAYHERGWKEGERKSQSLFVRRLSYINRYKMMIKNDQLGYMLRHLPALMVFEVLSLGYTLLREPRLLSSWCDLWRKLPELRAKRKWIMSKRRNDFHKIYSFFHQ